MPPIARKRGLVQETDRTPAILPVPVVGASRPPRMLRACSSRAPGRPEQDHQLTSSNAMSSVERVHLDIAHAVDLLRSSTFEHDSRMAPS